MFFCIENLLDLPHYLEYTITTLSYSIKSDISHHHVVGMHTHKGISKLKKFMTK